MTQDFAIEWVTVTTSKGGVSRTLTTVAGLAEFLLAECPGTSLAAQKACLAVLEEAADPAEARAAFIESVTAAGFHILDSGRHPIAGPPAPRWHKRKPKRRH